MKRRENGITLIALIITIIVMLILVAVTIAILINSGLIGKAKEGAQKTKTSYEQEQRIGDSLNINGEMFNSIDEAIGDLGETTQSNLTSTELVAMASNGVTEKETDEIINNNLKDTSKIKAVITDSGNGEIPIPVGAKYITGTENTGIVIEYKESEFVWVPITADNNLYVKGTTKSMARPSTGAYAGTDANGLTNYEGVLYDFNGTGNNTTSTEKTSYGQSTNSYREPADSQNTSTGDWATTSGMGLDLIRRYITGYSTKTDEQIKADWRKQLQEEYNEMIDSVKKYGGFYVGRYESSVDGTTVASISGVIPMSSETDPENRWYTIYQREKNFSGSDSSDTMQSSMIWGSQYDAMLNWILTGKDKGRVTAITDENHVPRTMTGEKTTDIMNNIYDLEGNLLEWTAEAYNTMYRIYRGGNYLNPTYSASNRYYGHQLNVDLNHSSRVTLCIK